MRDGESLPLDLDAYRQRYADLFGFVPPLPEARLAFAAAVDPEFLRLVEQVRARAFHSSVFDLKTTQLLLLGMLLALNESAARYHAVAARRAGASWEELNQVVQLAAMARALGPLNVGGAQLHQMRRSEEEEEKT